MSKPRTAMLATQRGAKPCALHYRRGTWAVTNPAPPDEGLRITHMPTGRCAAVCQSVEAGRVIIGRLHAAGFGTWGRGELFSSSPATPAALARCLSEAP